MVRYLTCPNRPAGEPAYTTGVGQLVKAGLSPKRCLTLRCVPEGDSWDPEGERHAGVIREQITALDTPLVGSAGTSVRISAKATQLFRHLLPMEARTNLVLTLRFVKNPAVLSAIIRLTAAAWADAAGTAG